MKLAIIASLIFFLAGCAEAPLRLTKESSQELVGCYVRSIEGNDSSFLLQLNPNMTYTAYVHGSLNIWAKATGKWFIQDNVLIVGQSRETAGWHHYMQQYSVYRDQSNIYIGSGSTKLVKSEFEGCEIPGHRP